MSTDLTTQEENNLMRQAIAEVGGRQFINIPQIGMVNNMSDIEGMSVGEFYTRKTVEEDGEKKVKTESIGFSPEVTIFVRKYTYSRFSKSQNKLLAWTNEFDSFFDDDIVHLINNKGEKPVLEFSAGYPSFKQYITKNYKDDEGKSTLKFKNVLYVKYGEEFYRFFLSNASVTGIQDGADHGDYKNPQKGSFMAFEKVLKAPAQAYFFRKVKLGSMKVAGKDYFLITFSDAGTHEPDVIKQSLKDWHKLKNDLEMLQSSQFKKFLQPSVESLPELDSEQPPESYDPAPSDLPF